MTTAQSREPNPFALMMEPEVIFAALASSDRLARLKSRICRPLDKPAAGQSLGDSDDAVFDEVAAVAIDATEQEDFGR